MYAVLTTGGKQYHATKGKVLRIETVPIESQNVTFSGIQVSENGVKDVTIHAESLGVFREKKVIIFKKKRRHNYRRKKGHRQDLLWIKITDIV